MISLWLSAEFSNKLQIFFNLLPKAPILYWLSSFYKKIQNKFYLKSTHTHEYWYPHHPI